jgi:DNA polymerase III delta prime subunit
MEKLDINLMLNRSQEMEKIKEILKGIEENIGNQNNITTKKGIYIYGDPGTGKTLFVTNLLKELNYDIVKYDAGDIRNKSIIDTITKHNMSDINVMSLFNKKPKRIVIIMDEIDGMNNGDKGGINALIKIIRPKKTKKQKLEDITLTPIICIGNYHMDKKIKELMKVCNVIELKKPTTQQIKSILTKIIPNIELTLENNIINYIQGDLRKLSKIYELYNNNNKIINNDAIASIFLIKSDNNNVHNITKQVINNNYSINQHLNVMNETDRTIIGLLWHENIIDLIGNVDKKISVPFYLQILNNICLSDYIDRITFQKQIWQFNEMSSLIKTFHNNNIYHKTFTKKSKKIYNPSEVRFTKVLTKYSTEYNNYIFIQKLCQQLDMNRSDLYVFFMELKNKYDDNEIIQLFENYDINKLDIKRIYRFLDRYIKSDIEDDLDDISV